MTTPSDRRTRARTAPRRRTLALAGALVAAGMTVLWLVVVPDRADTTSGLQSLAIRYGHPLSWALLTGLALSHAADAPKALRDGLGWGALASYAVFLAALAL